MAGKSWKERCLTEVCSMPNNFQHLNWGLLKGFHFSIGKWKDFILLNGRFCNLYCVLWVVTFWNQRLVISLSLNEKQITGDFKALCKLEPDLKAGTLLISWLSWLHYRASYLLNMYMRACTRVCVCNRNLIGIFKRKALVRKPWKIWVWIWIVVDSREHGNEPWVSVEGCEFLDQLSSYIFLKEDSVLSYKTQDPFIWVLHRIQFK